MTAPVGHLRNPSATRGDRTWAPPARFVTRTLDPFERIDDALAEFAAAGVRTIAIEGGDGTVREVLSRAPAIFAGDQPDFAIIAAGNTNLIARQAGRVDPAKAAALTGGTVRRRALPLLDVERSGARPLTGFILGTGAYEAATRAAQKEIALRHGPQVAFAVLRAVLDPAIRAPTPIGFAPIAPRPPPPGEAAHHRADARTLVAMTSLPGSLIYGLNPFWGEGPGALRWLDIAASPPRLALGVLFTAIGRPRRWMAEAYRSGRAEAATLSLERPFVMDGEVFDPGVDGRVTASARRTATFLSA